MLILTPPMRSHSLPNPVMRPSSIKLLRFDHRFDDARQDAHARMHAAFFVDFLIGAHRLGIADDVMHRGHAAFETLIQREDDAVFKLQIVKFRRDFFDDQLGALVQLAGGFAGLGIMLDMAAGRIGRVARDLRRGQRESVADRNMRAERDRTPDDPARRDRDHACRENDCH